VASELFPLMLDNVTKLDTWVGVTFGFTIGLLVLNGLEILINHIVEREEVSKGRHSHQNKLDQAPLFQITSKLYEQNVDFNDKFIFQELYQKPETYSRDESAGFEWEEEPIIEASIAIAKPSHRQHLNEHVNEIVQVIDGMEERCLRLFDENADSREAEALAELIDESTHNLQYKLDHCRR
jgi:hypothetical protein